MNLFRNQLYFRKKEKQSEHRRSGVPYSEKQTLPERSRDKYIQCNETLRDVLNGKLKIVQNKKAKTDSGSEEGEIEDKESDFEKHDTSKKDGYCPITTSPEDELNVQQDGTDYRCE